MAEIKTGSICFTLKARKGSTFRTSGLETREVTIRAEGRTGEVEIKREESLLTLTVEAEDGSEGVLTISGLALKAVLDAIKADPLLAGRVLNAPELVAEAGEIYAGRAYILAESTSQAVYEADAMVGWTKVGPGRGWRTADGYHVAILTSPHLLRGFPSTGRLYLGSGWDRSDAFVSQGSPFELARARGLEVWMITPNSRAILVSATAEGA